jgi:hypothetical protein
VCNIVETHDEKEGLNEQWVIGDGDVRALQQNVHKINARGIPVVCNDCLTCMSVLRTAREKLWSTKNKSGHQFHEYHPLPVYGNNLCHPLIRGSSDCRGGSRNSGCSARDLVTDFANSDLSVSQPVSVAMESSNSLESLLSMMMIRSFGIPVASAQYTAVWDSTSQNLSASIKATPTTRCS